MIWTETYEIVMNIPNNGKKNRDKPHYIWLYWSNIPQRDAKGHVKKTAKRVKRTVRKNRFIWINRTSSHLFVRESGRAFCVSAQTTRAVETGKVTFLSNHRWNPPLPRTVCTCIGMDSLARAVGSGPGSLSLCVCCVCVCVGVRSGVYDHSSGTQVKGQVPLSSPSLQSN